MPSSVPIVGGGLAAQRAAETLRAPDHRGPILDVGSRRATPDDGEALAYDDLIVASGARPGRLPMFARRPSVHTLRRASPSRRGGRPSPARRFQSSRLVGAAAGADAV